MRPARARFTVRRWIVAVAISGILCGVATYYRRSSTFGMRAGLYRLKAGVERTSLSVVARHSSPSDPEFEPRRRRIRHFQELARKYDGAARHPWLLVAPDPPEPPR